MRLPQRTLSALAAIAVSLALAAVPPAMTASAGTGDGCDPIDPAACLLPFPNDWYTVADGSTPTGRRVHMRTTVKNALGIPVSPGEWNRADGFSPGSMLLSRVPGVDLARSGAAPITDIGSSLRADAPIVIVDTATGERWPYWAELDANAPADRKALIVRPAKNFREGHHYAVALRNLRDASGNRITPNTSFAKILGPDLRSTDPLRERQRSAKKVFAALQTNGVRRAGLQLAWDFTVLPGRNPDKVPYWGISTFGSSYAGSAMIVWDSGSPAPPLSNTPPVQGRDPHSDPRDNAGARRQKATFLKTGTVVDVCGGGPCAITP